MATQEELLAGCDISARDTLKKHLQHWGSSYCSAFTAEEMLEHAAGLDALDKQTCVRVLIVRGESNQATVTVVSRDQRAMFAVITGVLAACGFSISSGDVFTSLREQAPRQPRRRHGFGSSRILQKAKPRYIIDRFKGELAEDVNDSGWVRRFTSRLEEAVVLLSGSGKNPLASARGLVNSWVTQRLNVVDVSHAGALLPVEISVDNSGAFTRLEVSSQDTPFFLYSLAIALSLRGISIEAVSIGTERGRVSDRIDVLDKYGKKIDSENRLAEIRFSVLLTKQFTYFLPQASDASAALDRFEHLTEDVFREQREGRHEWARRFSDPAALKDLARLLGASDFLWEDFIRTQYESLVPLLGKEGACTGVDFSKDAVRARRDDALSGAYEDDAWVDALNRWKDEEIYRVDLEHILHPDQDVRDLAEPLSTVAECVVECAVAKIYDDLCMRYGTPRTPAGRATAMTVFGLGKLGGVALGYASDIELLFVYSDSGKTDGEECIENGEFFEKLVKGMMATIRAKREGVFMLDLRLRPYGKSGPLASSLESFCKYYGPGGQALSYERLALVRLRTVAGDHELGLRVQRLRDEFIYETSSISVKEVLGLRSKQIASKSADKRLNAKFSRGALVDLEYCVQLLQVVHGGKRAESRTSRISEALVALAGVGVLRTAESERLTRAYYFLRRLINGLRMLRGNALDLFLPDAESLEFGHLARRMGYQQRKGLEVGKQLYVDFERHTAVIRDFVERYFGDEYHPTQGQGNVVDLLLSDAPSPELVEHVLANMGVKDPRRGLKNVLALAGDGKRREVFSQLAVLAGDFLRDVPDPDMALNNWERFVRALSDAGYHYRRMLLQPSRLEMMLSIFATSQFLADTLIRNPEFLDWVTDAHVLQSEHTVEALAGKLLSFAGEAHDETVWHNAIRRFRRREMLRIGTCDACMEQPIEAVIREISVLAEVVVDAVLGVVYESLRAEYAAKHKFAPSLDALTILAYGKLGGAELNYSSDIDLVSVFDTQLAGCAEAEASQFFSKVVEQTRERLMRHTAEGYVYRVDFRLRPYGRSGPLVATRRAFARYYAKAAGLWEVQALLKARPIAASRALGRDLMQEIIGCFSRLQDAAAVTASIRHMRSAAVQANVEEGVVDVKTGEGGIRDIEFYVQALQLLHMQDFPDLRIGATLEALRRLKQHGILNDVLADELARHYIFLRQVEHFLQIFEDRQIHAIPSDPAARSALAKRVLGSAADGALLARYLGDVRKRVRTRYLAGMDELAVEK